MISRWFYTLRGLSGAGIWCGVTIVTGISDTRKKKIAFPVIC
jgi:hypothetical protein